MNDVMGERFIATILPTDSLVVVRSAARSSG